MIDGVKFDVQVSGTLRFDIVITQEAWDAMDAKTRAKLIDLGVKLHG